VIGLGDADLEPVEIDLTDAHFLITGPYRSGRSTALASLAYSVRERAPEIVIHLLAPRRSPLTEIDIWTDIAQGTEACDAKAIELADWLSTRRDGSADGPVLVVVDDADELADSAGAPALERLVRRGRDLNLRVIAAGETNAIQRAFGGWIRELRKDKTGLLLTPDVDVDGDILGIRLPRQARKSYPPGRGFLVQRGSASLIQVASD
jgi:S-DNA-T family DNA segregation ATPase FtsK/SpoIIIE